MDWQSGYQSLCDSYSCISIAENLSSDWHQGAMPMTMSVSRASWEVWGQWSTLTRKGAQTCPGIQPPQGWVSHLSTRAEPILKVGILRPRGRQDPAWVWGRGASGVQNCAPEFHSKGCCLIDSEENTSPCISHNHNCSL